jgi:hypothetical protein
MGTAIYTENRTILSAPRFSSGEIVAPIALSRIP